MFTLQKLNVVRIVEDEYAKAKLTAEGFKEILNEVATEEVQKVKEIVKKSKGKE